MAHSISRSGQVIVACSHEPMQSFSFIPSTDLLNGDGRRLLVFSKGRQAAIPLQVSRPSREGAPFHLCQHTAHLRRRLRDQPTIREYSLEAPRATPNDRPMIA